LSRVSASAGHDYSAKSQAPKSNSLISYQATNRFIYYVIEQLFFIGMCNTLIPISMYMQIELQRFIGTKFFEWDLE